MVNMRRRLLLGLAALASARAGDPDEDPAPVPVRRQRKLSRVRRIYIDPLNGAGGAEQIRDLLFAAIQGLDLFILTENEENADAFLRGTAEDIQFTEYFDSREGINVRLAGSGSRRESGESNYSSASAAVGETTDTRRRENQHEALAALRLVLPDGEVIWSTTQESGGAKYRGAAAEVAARVADELKRSYLAAGRAGAP